LHLLPCIVDCLSDCDYLSAKITTGLCLPYEQGLTSNLEQGSNNPFADKDIKDTSDTSSKLNSEELAERLSKIKDVIEHLYKLLFKIHNTRYRALTKKALFLKKENLETGKDLFLAYTIFDC
jgi:hypothetical protein